MKYLRIICLVFVVWSLQSCMIKSKSNMDFAKRSDFSKDAEIVAINVPSILMKTFLKSKINEITEEDPILAMALKKIKKIKLMTVSGAAQSSLYEKFNTYLAKNDFEELMSLYSEGTRISINTQMKGDRVKKVMLGIIDDDDQVFVDIKSDLDINELNLLIEEYEARKVEHQAAVEQ